MLVLLLKTQFSKTPQPPHAREPPIRGDACSKAAMIPCKDRAVGSIPTVSIFYKIQTGTQSPAMHRHCGVVQRYERLPVKQNVAGSIPATTAISHRSLEVKQPAHNRRVLSSNLSGAKRTCSLTRQSRWLITVRWQFNSVLVHHFFKTIFPSFRISQVHP